MPEVSDIYDQSLELADVSVLVYSMASMYHVLKDKFPEKETWYIKDVNEVIEKYREELGASKFKNDFFGEKATDSFNRITEWARENEAGHEKDVYMTHVDVDNMKDEMVYCILVDTVHKRIVVVIRGTETYFGGTGMLHNVLSDIRAYKTKEDLPEALSGKPDGGIKHVWLHKGFHSYLNRKTKKGQDGAEITAKEEMLMYVMREVKKHPDYTVCCTGHSLGASLSTLAAYYLALDDKIPKPVNNINFQSPRLGDTFFLKTCRYLEEKGDLQICRFANNNDQIANAPSVNYFHVGIEMKLHKQARKPVERLYPRADISTFSFEWAGRLWGGSFFSNINFSNDHSDYVERMMTRQKQLKEMKSLSEMYQNTELTGFEKKA